MHLRVLTGRAKGIAESVCSLALNCPMPRATRWPGAGRFLQMDTHMNDLNTQPHTFTSGPLIDATPDAIRAGYGAFVSLTPDAWESTVNVYPWNTEFSERKRLNDVLVALRAGIDCDDGRIGPGPLGFSVPTPRVGSKHINLVCCAELGEDGGLSLTIALPNEL